MESGRPGKTRRRSSTALNEEALERLRAELAARRGRGGSSYPAVVRDLFEATGEPLASAALQQLAGSPRSRWLRVTAKQRSSGTTIESALAFLPEDAPRMAESPALLRHVFDRMRSGRTDIFTPNQLAEQLPSFLIPSFKSSLSRWMEPAAAPPGLFVVRYRGRSYLHLRAEAAQAASGRHEHLEPAPGPEPTERAAPLERPHPLPPSADGTTARKAPTAADFAELFEREFDRLDRASGSNNYVLVHDLRLALPQVDRSEFDACLRELRLARRFTMDSSDGRHVRLTPEQLEAGMREGGRLLVYVARR